MAVDGDHYAGLTTQEARIRLEQYGKNQVAPAKKQSFFRKLLHTLAEPMFLLLLIAAVIYFILGEPRDGAIMLAFVLGIISIDAVQEWKTDKTLSALRDLSAPQVKVVRDRREQLIASAELVPGDIMLLQEGVKIPADGVILACSDLSVDESSLTGEAEPVWKTPEAEGEKEEESEEIERAEGPWRRDYGYAGTLVVQGTATIRVEQTGARTEYGKIGQHIAEAPQEDTPLQKQTGRLVKLCAAVAAVLFALVGLVTWLNLTDHALYDRLIESALSGITLSMAMIPEEFPVILTVFLSLGAWRLAKKKSLVRRLPSVETLGAVSVLCVDKTGTITMNQMTVQALWAADGDEETLCETMGLACETNAYDPMEKAMLAYCEKQGIPKTHLFGGELLSEYAFTNELKMMGHIWYHDDEIIIAAKGSPERVLTLCGLDDTERGIVERQAEAMSGHGLRVIAVAICKLEKEADIPGEITSCALTLCGLVGLADPPRETVKEDIAQCSRAGIRVVMITGDHGATALAIARQIGMEGSGEILTGDMLEKMSDEELRDRVKTVSIFSRVVPEHKMRIVQAFQANGDIVAMTGDGVNDAPALKHADIGIAMGKRGSEVSREAADLVLMDDNFSTIVETVRDGRRIYDNIRRAVGYVFTIHIPIAAASLLAPLLGVPPDGLLLLPLHVALLELIVDPTCSIVLERQAAEADIMERKPRNPKESLVTRRMLLKSAAQGVAIFAASFGTYYTLWLQNPGQASAARAMGLSVIMLANLFLVQVNSSAHDSIFFTFRSLAKDKAMWAANILTWVALAVILYTPLSELLKLVPLAPAQLLLAFTLAAASVLWYEGVKWAGRRRKRNARRSI